MTLSYGTLAVWFALTLTPLWITLVAGFIAKRRAMGIRVDGGPYPGLEMFIPVKGAFERQEAVLGSLLEQDYPGYQVVFIIESLDDPANVAVDRLIEKYENCQKVIAGPAGLCAQKNHNLVRGTANLRPETRVLVFCDSTNEAEPSWLRRLTEPLRQGACQVVTTFRVFDPSPPTLGGVCQAIYAAFLLLLQIGRPTPWGGATAIRRDVFERLNVRRAWSNTVVDDLILGNRLGFGGVKTLVRPDALMRSPVRNQTVSGFIAYLDRQILFPKFTNPGIWMQSLLFHLNVTLALVVSLILGVLCPLGMMDWSRGLLGYGFLAAFALFAAALRALNNPSIALGTWMASVGPCALFTAFVFARSLVRNHIDWHGVRYRPGRGGIVRSTERLQ